MSGFHFFSLIPTSGARGHWWETFASVSVKQVLSLMLYPTLPPLPHLYLNYDKCLLFLEFLIAFSFLYFLMSAFSPQFSFTPLVCQLPISSEASLSARSVFLPVLDRLLSNPANSPPPRCLAFDSLVPSLMPACLWVYSLAVIRTYLQITSKKEMQ